MSMQTKPRFSARISALALGIALSFGTAQAYQVSNGKIYDAANQRVQLRGVNWFGFETHNHVAHGLWARNAEAMIAQMKTLGVNAVRIPVAPNTLHGAAVNSVDFGLNPALAGKNSVQALDYILEKLNQAGILILLDHHRPDDNAISALWYTDSYSEAQWLADLTFMAERYKHLPYFFGIELKNEPHGRVTWGTGSPTTDWNLAAERASQAVLAAHPELVVFVAGIQDQANCSGSTQHFWGGSLEPLRCMPLNIPANKLVLAPHLYGPDVYLQPYFSAAEFPANMPAIWNTHFGFAKDLGYSVVPTEFGSRYGHDGGLAQDKVWFDAAVDWMAQKDMRDGFFWSWNPNSGDTGGLLQNDWASVWGDKLAKLHTLWGYAAQPPVPTDTQPPVLQSANIQGSRLILVYNEVLQASSVPSASQFVVRIAQQTSAVQSVRVENSSVILTLSNSAQYAQAVELAYNGNTLADQAGHGAANFSGFAVTNNASAPSPEPTPNPDLLVGDELRVTRHVDSDWGTGYCVSYAVKNMSTRAGRWETSFGFIDRLDSAWSAKVAVEGTSLRAQGEGWNITLQPDQEVGYGYCATRPQTPSPSPSPSPAPIPVDGNFKIQVNITNDWGAGYCSEVRVTNTGTALTPWSTTVPMQGTLTTSWSARVQSAQGSLSAVGEDWNAYLQPGANTAFGFCANR